jgi:hypothetical protein
MKNRNGQAKKQPPAPTHPLLLAFWAAYKRWERLWLDTRIHGADKWNYQSTMYELKRIARRLEDAERRGELAPAGADANGVVKDVPGQILMDAEFERVPA